MRSEIRSGGEPAPGPDAAEGNRMDRIDIARLEDAGRSAMAWIPEGQDGIAPHPSLLLVAAMPAAGIIAVAALLLLAVL